MIAAPIPLSLLEVSFTTNVSLITSQIHRYTCCMEAGAYMYLGLQRRAQLTSEMSRSLNHPQWEAKVHYKVTINRSPVVFCYVFFFQQFSGSTYYFSPQKREACRRGSNYVANVKRGNAVNCHGSQRFRRLCQRMSVICLQDNGLKRVELIPKLDVGIFLVYPFYLLCIVLGAVKKFLFSFRKCHETQKVFMLI